MNRRNAINNLVVLTVGAMVLPSCAQKDEAAQVKLKNFSVTGKEEKMMAGLAAAILPLEKSAGAPDEMKAHEFTLMMVDDCYEPEDQQKFVAGLKEFEKQVKSKYSNGFSECTPAQKKEWLSLVESKTAMPEELTYFYKTTKRHTVQSFTSSRDYMTNVQKYKMVPGSNFKGCVAVKKA